MENDVFWLYPAYEKFWYIGREYIFIPAWISSLGTWLVEDQQIYPHVFQLPLFFFE